MFKRENLAYEPLKQPLAPVEHDEKSESSIDGSSTTKYVDLSTALLDIVDEMRTIGISYDYHLPEVVLFGMQSSGKTSLIQALSGIELPRSEGMCTRSELELQTRIAPRHRCRISLVREGAKPLQFGPVLENTNVQEFFLQVGLQITRALAAIRYPGTLDEHHLALFVEGNPSIMREETLDPLTSDRVVVNIAAPGLSNLTFIDLPGLIENEATAPSGVKPNAIREMVKKRIQNPNSLIVSAVVMEVDRATISSLSLLQSIDPRGERTVNVFTKHDRANPDTASSTVSDLVKGGFFTKWANAKERDSTKPFDQKMEAKYFEEKARLPEWKFLLDFPEQLGTANLCSKLSERLSQLCRDHLPSIGRSIVVDHAAAQAALLDIGEIDEDFTAKFQIYSSRMDSSMRSIFEAASGDKQFAYNMNMINEVDLKEAIRNLEPQLVHQKLEYPSEHSLFTENNHCSPDRLKCRIIQSIGYDLPGQIASSFKKEMIRESLTPWATIVESYFGKVADKYLMQLDAICESVFSPLRPPKRNLIKEEVRHCAMDQLKLAKSQLDNYGEELKYFVWTQNGQYDQAVIDAESAAITLAWPHLGGGVALEPVESYQTEIRTMAEVIAYYRNIANQAIDHIPRIVAYWVFLPSGTLFTKAVVKKLGIKAGDVEQSRRMARDLLAEDEKVHRQRKILKKKIAGLDQMMQHVEVLKRLAYA